MSNDNNIDPETSRAIIELGATDRDIDQERDSRYLQKIFFLFSRTPEKYIKQRPGRGQSGSKCRTCDGHKTIDGLTCKTCGGKGIAVDYVEISYIKEILNWATLCKWSSYIDGSKQEGDMVIVWGRVEIEIDGKHYTQSAFGRNEIKYHKGTKDPVDIGDSYKAAHSDMIKKAASSWGIAMDVYGKRMEE